MRIGFYQFSPRFGEMKANLQHIASALEDVTADLLVLPELGNSGYLFLSQAELEAVAESIPGPTTHFLQSLARRHNCHFVLGMPEHASDAIYNSAVLVGPKGVLGTYRKVHLFDEEKNLFEPGDLGFPLFEVQGIPVGILICFDHMFPEAARTLALQGAQVICHPSNLVLPTYGQLTTRVRSIENHVFWVLANRCGAEDRGRKKLTYTGCSQITAPDGRILAAASPQEETVKVVEIDPSQALDKQVTRLNDLFQDRRPECYEL